MARPLRVHIPHAYYHVISRGNAKQVIFTGSADYEHFLELLEATSGRFGVRSHAYCLMPNHYHLLLQPETHPLSRMMHQLNAAYCHWFNRRHDRVGHVLQGRFKALLVDRDEYFLQVVRYIVLNPVEAGLVDSPGEWRWSSYRATAGLADAPSFLTLDDVWRAFDADEGTARRRFVAFVDAGLGQSTSSETFVSGSEAFRTNVAAALEPHRDVRDFVRRERYAIRPTLESIFADSHDRVSCRRAMVEAYRRYGYTLREIGRLLGRQPSTILKQICRMESAQAEPVSGRDE